MPSQQSMVISYLTLRKAIGVLGTTLPAILALGGLIFYGIGIQNSISSYYHTGMRDVFVGTICVIGFFLLSYRGHDRADNIAGTIACMGAVGAALFPAKPDHATAIDPKIFGTIHLIFAGLFFVMLIYFALKLFPQTHPDRQPTVQKVQRNKIYKVCAYTMIISLALIVVNALLPKEIHSLLKAYHPDFWLESIAVVSFGSSWLVKGGFFLSDKA